MGIVVMTLRQHSGCGRLLAREPIATDRDGTIGSMNVLGSGRPDGAKTSGGMMKRATSYIVLIFAMVMLTQACASSQPTLSFEPGAKKSR